MTKKCPFLPLYRPYGGAEHPRDCLGGDCQLWWFCRGPDEDYEEECDCDRCGEIGYPGHWIIPKNVPMDELRRAEEIDDPGALARWKITTAPYKGLIGVYIEEEQPR